jgi:transcription elongation factor GreB
MGRYRIASPWGSPYITPEGEKTLREELYQLWKIERPQVTQTVHEAAKNGDRSENGDYIYGKKRLREIDRRAGYLSKRLEQLKIIKDIPANQTKIYFGAWVTIEDHKGTESMYRIVGPDEFDLKKKFLSMDSPLAKQMLGKQKEDVFYLEQDNEKIEYTVTGIDYHQASVRA